MNKNIFYRTSSRNSRTYVFLTLLLITSLLFILFVDQDYLVRNFIINHKTTPKNPNNMTKVKDLGQMPNWNLTDLYKDIDDTQINIDIENLEHDILNFQKTYKNQIAKTSGTILFEALKLYENIFERISKLGSYAYLKYSEDLRSEKNLQFHQKITEVLTNFSSSLAFFEIEINELSNIAIQKRFNQSKDLVKYYGTYIKNIRLFRNHQLKVKLQELETEKSITGRQAWVKLFDETIDGMEFNFDGKILNEAQILEIVNGSNEQNRKKAGKVFGETLGKNIKLLAYITNTLAKDLEISNKWHKYRDPIQERNLSNLIEDDVVEQLYQSVHKNYANISHRYYKLKAKILGKKKLHYTDRNAPLPFADENYYSWKEAKDVVLAAYRRFSPKMAEIGQKFFDNNWIDVPTYLGKRGGAYMHPTVPSVHPYILLNFQGKARDVSTLAHELGHGIHQYLAKDNGYFMSETPLTLAETASVFGEQLIFRYLLDKEKDPIKKIAILANKIEDMLNTVVRQIAFLEFEKTVHKERTNGELSVDRLNNIWLNVQKKSLGDAFKFDEEYKYYWAYIPHFIHTPFYVYAYAFGDCLVNSLFAIYMKQPQGFEKKYLELLKAGGSKKYTELLEPFGLDPHNKDFWQNGMNMISDLINSLEELLEEQKI